MLTHLHRGGQWAYLWSNPDKRTTWFPAGSSLPSFDADKHNIYFSVHPASCIPEYNTQGKKSSPERVRAQVPIIAAINCLFSEFDAKDFHDKSAAFAHVSALDPRPSVVIDSGGGFHAYWFLNIPYRLDTDAARERAIHLQYVWTQYTGGDPGARDLARVLRLPGTWNHKYTPARQVDFVTCDFERLYPLDDLARLIDALPDSHPAQPARPRTYTQTDDTARVQAWLDRLAPWRCDTYRAWLEVGLALSELGADGLALWDNWSQASDKYRPGECGRKWDTFAPGQGLTLASLRFWADQDDPASVQPTVLPASLLPDEPPPDLDAEQAAQCERFHCTDLGNAQRLVRLHGQDLHYCYAWGKWLIWDGIRWVVDETGEIYRRAKHTTRMINVEAADCLDDDQRRTLQKWAYQSESRVRIDAMVRLAQSEPGIPVQPDDLDTNPWLLNVKNGVIDLRIGELLPHRREDLITKLASVAYTPGTACPTFDAFLQRIMGGSRELIEFIRRAVGYSLTGDTGERVMFILHGTGANGKSTLLETLRALLGDYALRTPTRTLMTQRSDQIPNDVARLRGARFVSASESEESQSLAESLIKDVTGGDTISARFMRAEWFEFQPTCKIWLATNHRPVIRGTDQAIWDRIRLIPFAVRIPDEERDKTLGARLVAERSGILNWALAGCLAWQRQGLGVPVEVRVATSSYQAEMDQIAQFLDDAPLVQHANARIVFADLYTMYRSWAERAGEYVLSKRAFSKRLTERGFAKDRGAQNVMYLHGIGLCAQEEFARVTQVTQVT